MANEIFLLFFNLLLILLCAEVFTNGLEVFGKKLSLSQAIVGSVLAAVGTALPETIIPLVAIFLHRGETGHSIGVGAILGAPFMLATMAFLMIGLTITSGYITKRRTFVFEAEISTVKRDLIFFLLMYSSGIFLPLITKWHIPVAVMLLFGYIFYLYTTFRSESNAILHEERLYFDRILGKILPIQKFKIFFSLLQVLISLLVMIKGAHGFVEALGKVSFKLGVDPLIFEIGRAHV